MKYVTGKCVRHGIEAWEKNMCAIEHFRYILKKNVQHNLILYTLYRQGQIMTIPDKQTTHTNSSGQSSSACDSEKESLKKGEKKIQSEQTVENESY